MPVNSTTSAPRVATTAKTTESFDVQDFVKNSPDIQNLRYMVAGTSAEKAGADQKLANSSFAKSFDAGLKKAIDKLGPNATEEQVMKAANNEAYKQEMFKSIVNKACDRVLSRVKDMYSDTWG
ncbi:hypothetical protein [Hyalangium versicolor]|uniref:hypothetical protein n=1 Tax=Hyalangium versicolor TaxID=2861190 RepID=UPI001CCCF11F|nr:hypothetical protein [Hyalangium versicolor]